MPKAGETIHAYCGKCNRETTWVFTAATWWVEAFWQCLGCGIKRNV
jgi:hypothetical protein